MRLWSLHPRYLDPQGLVALWREALLAQRVLEGRTVGYRHHPQLARFQGASDPRAAIAAYLHHVADEAGRRGYSFNTSLISAKPVHDQLTTSLGQIRFEARHLRDKLLLRSPALVPHLRLRSPLAHPLFTIVPGPVEHWERRPPAET